MSSDVVNEVFSAGDHPALKISNIAGRVVITGAPISEIRVAARKHNDGDTNNTIITMNQHEDSSVEVKVEHEQGPLHWLFSSKSCRVDFDIQVPHNCKVNASVISADLEMRFLQGDLQASGVSGELELENLDGAISISTVSGEVDASNLLGNLHLSTVSGDVTLEHSDLQSLKLSTISARVEIETAIHPDGVYRLSTISGDIDWLMPEDPACRVKSSAISGRVVVASPGTRTHHTSGKRHSLILGEGGPDVILSSISGDLKIHTSIATPATI